jgi:hypothetical protein
MVYIIKADNSKTRKAKTMFLVVPKSELAGFVQQSDREFFSVPVEVQLLHTNISTKLTTVYSPLQDATYPVSKNNLKHFYQLSNKQHKNARKIG